MQPIRVGDIVISAIIIDLSNCGAKTIYSPVHAYAHEPVILPNGTFIL
jgi:hypothetical protein